MSPRACTGEPAFRLSLAGPMTVDCRQGLEEKIISAMRQYKHLEADLSQVSAIDPYGLHLLDLLQHVGSVVATSPVVEAAAREIPLSGQDQGDAI